MLAGSTFCSDKHRQAFEEEQKKSALASFKHASGIIRAALNAVRE
jgi:hypothetical protein